MLNVEPNSDVALEESSNRGSGKSTLLRVIAGHVMPAAGQITLGERDLLAMSPLQRARSVHLVQQDPTAGTADTLSCLEHLLLARPVSRLFPSALKREQSLEVLASAGLQGRAHHLAGQLSGGERQILTLLMAETQPAPLLPLVLTAACWSIRTAPSLRTTVRDPALEMISGSWLT